MLARVQEILFDHLLSLQKEREKDNVICSRASSAGKCSRAIGFQVSGLPASNPPTGESLMNFYIGDAIHDVVQTAMLAKYPDAEKELEGSIGDYIQGHLDLRYSAEDGNKVICEIKSVADFAFMKATGISLKSNGRWYKKESEAEGPKKEHILQAGIYCLMFDAPYLAIVYVRKTATINEPVAWEWRFSAGDYADEIIAELDRHAKIVDMVRNNEIPERIFEGRTITDPDAKENRWPCQYCQYIGACKSLGPGQVKIA